MYCIGCLIVYSTLFFSYVATQCNVQVSSYGNADSSGRYIFFKFNGVTAYLRAELAGYATSACRGFHLAYMDARTCDLITEPVHCDTYWLASGSPCVRDTINSFTADSPHIFLLVATGKFA